VRNSSPKPESAGPDDLSGSLGAGKAILLDPALEPAAAPVLALAFRDNPINRAVIEGNLGRRLKVNTHGMVASLAATRRFSFRLALREPQFEAADGTPTDISAGLVALNPGGYPAALPPLAVQLRCLWGQGFRVMHRWGQLYRQLDECHPKEPHCYLSLLAVHPARQRRGLGRSLLDAWLADVDARQMPSYLETDRKELVGFYQSAGFQVEHELEAFGASIWCMSRSARL
jgi:ribosomal protein S18 acetylase RimI-like enzyme